MARDKTDLINLENAGVRRDNRWLVRGVDLRIRKGEIVTIIGPNGAGKSTTAKMAVGTIHGNEVSIFMLCTQCERAHEFTDTSIDSRLQSLGNDRGFQAAHKVIEITDLCADCQTAQTAAQKH